jgi:hypothetical protein
VSKSADSGDLERAIREVAAGHVYLSPTISSAVVDLLRKDEADERFDDEPLEKLTPREREVLRLVADGRSSREIAVHAEDRPEDRRDAPREHRAEAQAQVRRGDGALRGALQDDRTLK